MLKQGLERLALEQPLIQSVRGQGLLLAAELIAEPAPDLVRLGIDEGVWLNFTGPTTIRFAPPLILTSVKAAEAVEKLKRALARLAAPGVPNQRPPSRFGCHAGALCPRAAPTGCDMGRSWT